MRSIEDLIEDGGLHKMTSVTLSRLTLFEHESLTSKKMESNESELSKAQLDFLSTFEYSTNFEARIEFKEKDELGNINMNYRTPYLTVVPEQQAEYSKGEEQLLLYLQDNIQNELMGVIESKLQPAKLFFTITPNGSIKQIDVQRSSGYDRIDNRLKELIKSTEKDWKSARNSLGIPVEQELVVSYGALGC